MMNGEILELLGEKENSKVIAYLVIKRIFDVICAILGIIFFLLPMLLIFILIKLTSKGPAFFRQERTGLNGNNFILYKFRTMSVDNDVLNFHKENEITKIGKFLRKTSLDELPQLFNILKGDMSFIGPRPWIPEYYEKFNSEQKHRVDVLPGITGLAQALGRNNLSIFEKIDLDLKYVNSISLYRDVTVIYFTIKTVLSKNGAEISKHGIKDELKLLENQNK